MGTMSFFAQDTLGQQGIKGENDPFHLLIELKYPGI